MDKFFDIPLMVDDADTQVPDQNPDQDTVVVSDSENKSIEVPAVQDEAEQMCSSVELMLDKLEELEFYQSTLQLNKVTPQDIRVLTLVRGLDLEVSVPAVESWDDRTSELYGDAALEAIGGAIKKAWDWIMRQLARLGDMFKRFITGQGLRLKLYEKKLQDLENQINNTDETNPDGKFESVDPDVYLSSGDKSFAFQLNTANNQIQEAYKLSIAAQRTMNKEEYTAATSAVGKAENVVQNLLKATPKLEQRNYRVDTAKALLNNGRTFINNIQMNQSAMNEFRKDRDAAQRQVSATLKNGGDPGPAKAKVAAHMANLKIANQSFKLFTKQIDIIMKSVQNYIKVCRGAKVDGDKYTADSNGN